MKGAPRVSPFGAPPWAPYTGVIAIPTMRCSGRVPPLHKRSNNCSTNKVVPKGTTEKFKRNRGLWKGASTPLD